MGWVSVQYIECILGPLQWSTKKKIKILYTRPYAHSTEELFFFLWLQLLWWLSYCCLGFLDKERACDRRIVWLQSWYVWTKVYVAVGLKSDPKLMVCLLGCRPYSIAPCEHHVNGTRPPCQGMQDTPKCEEKCIDGYSPSYPKDKHFGTDLWNDLPLCHHSSLFPQVMSLFCASPSAGRRSYSLPSQQDQIMTELYKNGPVEAAFSVYADFLQYKTGKAGFNLQLH